MRAASLSGPTPPNHMNTSLLLTFLRLLRFQRRALAAMALASALTPAAALAQQAPSAATRMNELGPENSKIAERAGLWDVTETVWDSPNAAPVVTKGLVAERRMVGQMLQETLRSDSYSSGTILRMDYLSFNRVEARWEYVSIETRAAVGLMTAQSYNRDEDGRILVTFQPFAIPGSGSEVAGRMLRMRQEIIAQGADREVKNQYFTLADGTGSTWLAHRYAYVRRP